MERCPSGRRSQTRNLVWGSSSPRVRIPITPNKKESRINLKSANLFDIFIFALERCPSGRRCTIGSRVRSKAFGGSNPPLSVWDRFCAADTTQPRQDREVATVSGPSESRRGFVPFFYLQGKHLNYFYSQLSLYKVGRSYVAEDLHEYDFTKEKGPEFESGPWVGNWSLEDVNGGGIEDKVALFANLVDALLLGVLFFQFY